MQNTGSKVSFQQPAGVYCLVIWNNEAVKGLHRKYCRLKTVLLGRRCHVACRSQPSIIHSQTVGHPHHSEKWAADRSYKIWLIYMWKQAFCQWSNDRGIKNRLHIGKCSLSNKTIVLSLSTGATLWIRGYLVDFKTSFHKAWINKMHWYGIIFATKRESFYFLPEILKSRYLNELPAEVCDQTRQRTIILLVCFLPLSLDIKFNLCRSNLKKKTNKHIIEITMAFLFTHKSVQ